MLKIMAKKIFTILNPYQTGLLTYMYLPYPIWDHLSTEHPKHMLKIMGKKIFTILRQKFLFIETYGLWETLIWLKNFFQGEKDPETEKAEADSEEKEQGDNKDGKSTSTYIWAKIWQKGPSGNKSQKWDIYREREI